MYAMEIRAADLEPGDRVTSDPFTLDDPLVVNQIAWHGDTVLVFAFADIETSFDRDEVLDIERPVGSPA